MVRIDEGASFVIADVPGIIEGAHKGVGLGTRFLRHLSRTGTLVHLIDLDGTNERDPLVDIDTIDKELANAEVSMAEKPRILVANKMDLPEARENFEGLRRHLEDRGKEILAISTATGEGLSELVGRIAAELRRLKIKAKESDDD